MSTKRSEGWIRRTKKLKLTLKVFVEQLFSQLGGRVYRRLEAARPLGGACVEVFLSANEHHIVIGETRVHQSFMTRAIAV